MREIRSYGTVGGLGGNAQVYPERFACWSKVKDESLISIMSDPTLSTLPARSAPESEAIRWH
jgi:hypothetical protein